MNVDRLISLKENFTGQQFQWIRTNDTSLRGKIVKCKDIQQKGNKFIAHFNDGSRIDANLLNKNLMMIGEGMQTLSPAEIHSINTSAGPPQRPSSSTASASGEGPIKVPDDLKQFETVGTTTNAFAGGLAKKSAPRSSPPPPKPVANMFSMFNTDDINLSLNVKVKLPNKKLLKMMYENADDKNKFLIELSEYVYSKINNTIVSESIKKIMVPVSRRGTISVVSKTNIQEDEENIIKVTELKDGE